MHVCWEVQTRCAGIKSRPCLHTHVENQTDDAMLGFGTNPRLILKTKGEIISKIPILAASHASSLSNLSVCLSTRHLFLVHPWWNLEVRGVELSAV